MPLDWIHRLEFFHLNSENEYTDLHGFSFVLNKHCFPMELVPAFWRLHEKLLDKIVQQEWAKWGLQVGN